MRIVLEGKVILGKEIARMIDIITAITPKQGVVMSDDPLSEEDYAAINSTLLISAIARTPEEIKS